MKIAVYLLLVLGLTGCITTDPAPSTTPCELGWTRTDKPYLTKIYYTADTGAEESVTVEPYINIYRLEVGCDKTYYFTATHLYEGRESARIKPIRWHSPKCE